jgi:hypothetical protein
MKRLRARRRSPAAHRHVWDVGLQLAPRPGLEPETCGLTVRRSKRRINARNQVLICFSVGSVFRHLMGLNAPGRSDAPTLIDPILSRPGFQPTPGSLGYLKTRVSGSFRRSCDRSGLTEPSVETRFAKSGVFAGE